MPTLAPALRRVLSTALLALLPGALAFAQTSLDPVLFEAEAGTFGSQFSTGTDATVTPGVSYAFPTTNLINPQNPGSDNRVATYSVTFPAEGVWQLYARVRVGPGGANDDSFFYGNGFGIRTSTLDNNWITANNFTGGGYVNAPDRIEGAGFAGTQVWKWIRLSGIDWGEGPINFTVPAGSLTQTLQIGGREDGLRFDKFAFGQLGVFFTVNQLNNGLPGTTDPPDPPFIPTGPPMALDIPKFVGGVSSPSQNLNLNAYFNQVTPENAGKWGSVEGTRDTMNWAQLDTAYNLAKNNLLRAPGDARNGSPYPLPFRMHALIWGNQQPAWIESLPPNEQREEIEEWYAAVAARYPDIDFIDVVNEPIHDPPAGAGNGNYLAALGGTGTTGYDWVITSFELARQYFPTAALGINEYSVTNSTATMSQYIAIIDLLKERGLIDTVGVQGHAFSTTVPAATTIANLDLLATTGLPVYVTELDIDGPSDAVQLAAYQRIFPAFWEHPSVRGVTLWGYRPGHWRTAQGAFIVQENGAERDAMVWLQDYVRNTILRPWMTTQPLDQAATVGDTVSLSCAGDGTGPLGYVWRKDGSTLPGNATAATAALTLSSITTADAGSYDCVVSNAAGSATSRAAVLSVQKALATIVLGGLDTVYDGAPHAATVATDPAGLTVVVTYDGSLNAPVNAGTYAVAATVVDADYFGSAVGTLTIARAVVPVGLAGLGQAYDGTPRIVSVTTNPPGLVVDITYGGSLDPPVAPGSYDVVATINDLNYVGTASGTLVVTTTALVRHAPGLSGRVTGSVQVILPEDVTVNGSARVSGDLLVPGTPTVHSSGHPTYEGTIDGDGDAEPSAYSITLEGGAALRHVRRRTDPVLFPTLAAPPAPTSTRDVVLSSPAGDAGDFGDIRNLTLNGHAGEVVVPAGTYGKLTANGHNAFTLGVPGATEPAVYNLQGLTLNGSSPLRIVGPVVVNLAGGVTVNGTAGAAANPAWLRLNVSAGDVTLHGHATLNGLVIAPLGTVGIQGTLNGRVISDRLVITGRGRLIATE